MDEVESNRQKRSHIELYNIAIGLGLRDRDLFVLAPRPKRDASLG